VRIADFFDISVIAVILYFGILWLRERSSRSAIGGILGVAALYACARTFDMYLTSFLFQAGFTALLVALVVVFQMDIRRLFERLASRPLFKLFETTKEVRQTSDVLVDAAFAMASKSIGALIVLKGQEAIDMHIRAGTQLDGLVTKQIITNIFYPRSPGHDGAMLIEGNRIRGFGMYLPLSMKSTRIGTGGTRHSAALGMAERSDAFVIVVSEERGTVSVAYRGALHLADTPEKLHGMLVDFSATVSPDTRRRLKHLVENPGIKILSVVLAASLWMLFARRAESVSRSFEAPIEFRNVPDGWVIEETQPSVVRIALSGRKRMFETAENSLKISLEPDSLFDGVQNETITEDDVVRPAGLAVDKISPASVKIRAYKTTEVQIPVKVLFSGRMPRGMKLVKTKIEPETVRMLVRSASTLPPDSLTTEPVQLADIKNDTVVRARLKIPARMRLIDPAQPEVRVTLTVEKTEK
jgi:uncharacterized protein (TIGR00159 family)